MQRILAYYLVLYTGASLFSRNCVTVDLPASLVRERSFSLRDVISIVNAIEGSIVLIHNRIEFTRQVQWQRHVKPLEPTVMDKFMVVIFVNVNTSNILTTSLSLKFCLQCSGNRMANTPQDTDIQAHFGKPIIAGSGHKQLE